MDFEAVEPKKTKIAPSSKLFHSQLNEVNKQKKLSLNAQTQCYNNASSTQMSSANQVYDEWKAFAQLLRESTVEKMSKSKGYFTLSEIQRMTENHELPSGKVPLTVCTIVSFSMKSVHGDVVICVKDRSGSMNACIQRSLLRTLQPNVLSIKDAAILLTGVSVCCIRRTGGGLLSFVDRNQQSIYLNITPKNISCVYFTPQSNQSENSLDITASGIKRIFCQHGVNTPNLLAQFVQNYVTDFYQNCLPSVSEPTAIINPAPSSGDSVDTMEEDDIGNTLIRLIICFY